MDLSQRILTLFFPLGIPPNLALVFFILFPLDKIPLVQLFLRFFFFFLILFLLFLIFIHFVYLLPPPPSSLSFSLSQERRLHLLEVARKFELLVLEDDPYYHVHYSPENRPQSLFQLDEDGRVMRYLEREGKEGREGEGRRGGRERGGVKCSCDSFYVGDIYFLFFFLGLIL